MGDFFGKIFKQIQDFFRDLSPIKQVGMLATTAVIVAGVSALFFWAGDSSFRPLMTNLAPEDSAKIIRLLREKKIPFKVSDSGKDIEVPPENLYELRLELATSGLPESSTVGYEIFDNASLGTTSFVHGVNQKRALEGELMRTIQTLKEVKRARVHLAIPKKSAFVEDQQAPTAAVVLDLHPGAKLAERQIYGIGTLVGKAVEGLDINNVSIVDSHGKLLSKTAHDSLVAVTATQLDFKRNLERALEAQVISMLGRIVGDGKVVATVTADLDFSRVSETQTIYDPDGSAVRSSNTDVHTMTGNRPGPMGVAGAKSNTPGEEPAVNRDIKQSNDRNREVKNYEVPTTVRNTVKPYGSITKMSVAVLIDEQQLKERKDDGTVLASSKPWSPEKLEEFRSIVSKTVGLDTKRGDSLDLKTMPFQVEDFEEAQRAIVESERRSYFQNIIMYGLIGLVIALFFMFVVRPFIKWITENTIDSVDTFLPQTIEELEKLQKDSNLPGLEEAVPIVPEKIDPEKVEGEMIREKIITLVDSNPHKAALILRDWLHEKEADKKAKEAQS